MKKAITGNKDTQIKDYSPIDEYTGKLGTNLNKGLMRSVIENDKATIENGKLIQDSINQGLASFTPSTMFEQLVKNYTMAKKIFGESLLRKITGYEPSSLEQNIKIPEFQRELLNRMEERFEKLKEDKLIDREGRLTDRAIDLASIILYVEEIENIMPKGITGERISKKEQPYGEKDDVKEYRKNRYKDIAIRKSLGRAVRRGHQQLITQDLMTHKRKGKDQRSIIYCIDASGSMKGEKLEKCKKAGVALAFKAISEKDKAGLIIFGTEIKASIAPTQDFAELLKEITKARASAQTDISKTIKEATRLFPKTKTTKHLILITDSIPTTGTKPEEETIQAASIASSEGITISLVGIKLEKKGLHMAERIVEAGNGRLYIAKDLQEIDKIVLMDYNSI